MWSGPGIMMKPIQLEGHVVRKRVSRGSKSDRLSLILMVDDGREFLLRRKGEDSYTGQDALVPLLDKRIRAFGSVTGRHLFLERYQILDPEQGT